MNTIDFQKMVSRILNEEIQKRVPEMNGNGVDPEKKNKTFKSDPNTREGKSKEEMEEALAKTVQSIDKTFTVVWDDHDDLMVNGRDRVFMRITPLWEDNFKIVFYTRNEDRVFLTGLSWEQVIDFVKENLDKPNLHTSVEKARDKSWRNMEDQTDKSAKGLSQDNKPTHKKVGDTSNRNKDYNEKQVKEEKDLPNQPMREPSDTKKQSEYKVKDPVKLRKKVPDKKLVIKQT